MPAVIRALLQSPLAESYRLETIPTYRDRDPVKRVLLFGRALTALTRWCAGSGPGIAHVHMGAGRSRYGKPRVVGGVSAMSRPVVRNLDGCSCGSDALRDGIGPST